MALEVINVLNPFLAFVITLNLTITHNMCAFQIDINFEDLQCVMYYVHKDKIRAILEKYDEHVLISLLMKVSKHLNPRSKASLTLLAFNIVDPL